MNLLKSSFYLVVLLLCSSSGLSFAMNANDFQGDETAQYFKLHADLGYKGQQCDLGEIYYHGGFGLEVDKETAFKWFKKSAEQGHGEAQYYVGLMYDNGEAVEQNKTEAAKWYKIACEHGYGDAYSKLAVLYENGLGVDHEPKEAARLFELAAKKKQVDDWFLQALCIVDQIPLQKQIKLTKKAAEHGHLSSQSMLGLWYHHGYQGLTQDMKEAVKWYRMAAEQGDYEVQYNLALMYYNGEGIEKNNKEAVKWFRKAAENGLEDAQFDLGILYYRGNGGLLQDKKKAAKWFEKTAELGHSLGQYNLAQMYNNGEGIEKDNKEAVKWYRMAAEQGHAPSQYNLALMYYNGEGIEKNNKEAVKWFRKAAELGDLDAQISLGMRYINGEGVLQDEIMAYALFSLAAVDGNKQGRKNRDIAAKKLSKQEIKQGRKIAADLQRKIEQNQLSEVTISTPKVITTEPKISGSGSAFIITNNGYIVTCYHVVKDATQITIFSNNKEYSATLIRADKHNDIALLKIDGSFPALSFGTRNSVKMGSDVFTIGYPNPTLQGVNQKLTEGNISALTGYQDDIRHYQVSVPVQPGNSGGALLNENGDVIGVIVAILKAETAFMVSGSLPQNVNYALKSTFAQALIDTVPEAIDSLQKPHRKKSKNVVARVRESVVMVLAYK